MENKEKKEQPTNLHRNHYMTGEDIDMLREKNRKTNNDYSPKGNVCDYHEDGA
jgi:hypothetical protein